MYWGTAEMLLGSVYFILHLAFICQKLEAKINLLVIELVLKKAQKLAYEKINSKLKSTLRINFLIFGVLKS